MSSCSTFSHSGSIPISRRVWQGVDAVAVTGRDGTNDAQLVEKRDKAIVLFGGFFPRYLPALDPVNSNFGLPGCASVMLKA